LRNLANAAKLLDDNLSLPQLRLSWVLEGNPGNTVVMMPSEAISGLKELGKKA